MVTGCLYAPSLSTMGHAVGLVLKGAGSSISNALRNYLCSQSVHTSHSWNNA